MAHLNSHTWVFPIPLFSRTANAQTRARTQPPWNLNICIGWTRVKHERERIPDACALVALTHTNTTTPKKANELCMHYVYIHTSSIPSYLPLFTWLHNNKGIMMPIKRYIKCIKCEVYGVTMECVTVCYVCRLKTPFLVNGVEGAFSR